MKIEINRLGEKPVLQGNTGVLLDDANYAIDGGLYAELLENRNFEAKRARTEGDRVLLEDDGGYAWEPYPAGADVFLKIKTDRALFFENPHYMRVAANAPVAGMKNRAYGGIFLKKGAGYKISFYARSYDYKGAATVGIYQGGAPLFCKKIKFKADGKWKKYAFRFRSKRDCDGADFVFLLLKAGIVHVDCFSMMPENAVLGVFRRDLIEKLKALKPGFVRFPGGRNGVLWKASIGQPERRKYIPESFAAADTHGCRTLGVGYYEYFRLCELIGAKPVPVVNTGDGVLSGDSLETRIQDALDVAEFARGGTDTVWGRVRSEAGHPAPFALEYLALTGGEKDSDPERLALFERRLLEKYPDLKIVYGGDSFLVPPEEMYRLADDLQSSSAEYAACPARRDGWEGALAEAAFLTAAERNADRVRLAFYANAFARVGQNAPALVRFDGKESFATASYFVLRFWSQYTGSASLQVTGTEGKVYASATVRENMTFVKIVNAGEEETEAEIAGDFDFGSLTRIVRLEGERGAGNTLAEPNTVFPAEIAPRSPRTATLAPRSVNVLVFMK